MSFAFGEMGLTPHEYYCMTRAEFLLKCKGFQDQELKGWQQTRKIAWQIYASQPFAKKRPQSIYKFMPLPNDPTTSDLDFELIKQEWDSFKNERNAKS